MKTNPTLKIFKPSTLATLAIAIVTASVTQSVMAQSGNQLVFTEDSSSSLSVTYNGSTNGVTVIPQGADQWEVVEPQVVLNPSVAQWAEPEPGGFVNHFTFLVGNAFTVFSDTLQVPGLPVTADDTGVQIGTDGAGTPIIATFDDDAATAEATVPDTGSTLALFALALAALFGASRFRALRLA